MTRHGPAWRCAWAGCALALALTGCKVTVADFFLYHPSRELVGTPRSLGLAYEDAWFTAEDGARLHGWFVPAPAAPATLIWFHGNAGNISHRLDNIGLLHRRLGIHIFIFDYRGYGQSDGRPSEAGLYRDARAALATLRRHPQVRPDRIVFFGRSLGAAVAVDLATQEPPLGLILESPFLSVRAMGKAVFPLLPVDLLVGNQYDSLPRVARVRVPLLVLHGDRDEVVPFSQGRALFEAANEPKTFFTIAGAGHNDTYVVGGAAYLDAWARFLEGLELPPRPPARS